MSAIGGTSATDPASSANALSAFTNGEFLELIFTELTNQDPLSPSETKDLIQQISTIRSIESDVQFASRFDELVDQNQLTVSSSLIGKFVTGLDQFNTETASFVDSVLVTDQGTMLNLSNGVRLPVENVREIIDPALVAFTDPETADDAAAVVGAPAADPVENASGAPGSA